MGNDITYIGITNEPEIRSNKKKSKEAVFKTRKHNINISKLISNTKNTIFNKKLIILLVIVCILYFFNPITFLKNKLDEKREFYAQNYSNPVFSSEIGLMDSIVYLSGADYYKNCKDTLVMPADGLLTYPYDWNHQGIDISCDIYQDNIYAAANGYVCHIGPKNEILIEHEINGMTLYTFYSNLSVVYVTKGQYVTQNQVIALEGGNPNKKAGIMDKDGHHIHFEVRKTMEPNSNLNPTILIDQ
ncbi:MAG: M23 family metallopeptidase [Clostridia bacterium]|nr:M23 family metallopeptidase [Clostridia bacterium]